MIGSSYKLALSAELTGGVWIHGGCYLQQFWFFFPMFYFYNNCIDRTSERGFTRSLALLFWLGR